MKKILLIIICLALVYFVFLRIKDDWQRYHLLTREVESLEQRKESLAEGQKKLEQLLEQGKEEEILEEQARLMLGLKKTGEKVILVLPPTTTAVPETTPPDLLIESLQRESSLNVFLSKLSQIWYNLTSFLKRTLRE